MRRIYTPIPKKIVLPRPSPDYLVPVINLDGSSYLSHADDPALQFKVSDGILEAWIWSVSAAKQPIICKAGAGGYYDFHINATTGYLECVINDGINTATITGDVAVNNGIWHHVLCALDKSSATGGRLYVDGTEDTSAQTDLSSVGNIDNDGDFYTGYDGTNYFVGKIALPKVWNQGYGGLQADVADYDNWRYANPYAALDKFPGDWSGYADALRTTILNEGDFATVTKWSGIVGDWDLSGGNAHYVFSSQQTSVFVQTSGNRVQVGDNSSFYEFTYTVTVNTAPNGRFGIKGLYFVDSTVLLDVTAGTHRIVFVSASDADVKPFRIRAYDDNTQGNITIDDVSLKRVGNVLKCDGEDDGTGKLKDDTSNDLDLTAYPGGSAGHYTKSKMLDYDYIPFKRYKR